MRKYVLMVLLWVPACPVLALDYAAYGKVASSVVRIAARVGGTNSTSLGSGVVLADGRIVTNCHVIPGAGKVTVIQGALGSEAERGPGDAEADLCLLRPAALDVPRAQAGASGGLRVGDEVVAIGFGGGAGRSLSSGRVTALYPYHNGSVIQSSAAFRQGASGGGLFDAHGHLVGITTFFRRNGAESAFFAIPIEWIDALPASTAPAVSSSSPFWMRARGEQPLFLQVAGYEADGKWAEMKAAARLWTEAEPDRAQSWEALSRALMALGDVLEGRVARFRASQAPDAGSIPGTP